MTVKSTTGNKPPPLRKAFLIRCWQQEEEWRYMLEDISTRERKVFFGVAEMVEWLTTILNLPAIEDKSMGKRP